MFFQVWNLRNKASPRDWIEKTFGSQPYQALADGRCADAEAIGDLINGNRLSRPKLVVDQHLFQSVVDRGVIRIAVRRLCHQ